MPRIYADWNSMDEQGRLRLDIVGSLRDIHRYEGALREGMRVMLNVQDEFEIECTLVFDGIWRGVPDMSTLKGE